MKSINQVAQADGDTSAREAERIREREHLVVQEWRRIAYYQSGADCTAARIAAVTGFPPAFVRFVCGAHGLELTD